MSFLKIPENLPYQFGNTYMVGNKRVHTRTIFSLRMRSNSQMLLQMCLDRAQAALTHCITRAQVRAPQLRNETHVLGPFDALGNPTTANFSNRFLFDFRLDAGHAQVVADKMDTFRNLCVSIQRGLQGALDIVDLPIGQQHGDTCGYVNRHQVGERVEHRGAIHIDFGRISVQNVDGIANTLIHEASHKFTAAKDYAYPHQEEKWGNLTSTTAIDNADSISRFAMAALVENLQ